MMIATIDQYDLGIASSQCPRRCDPGKAAANDDDALTVRWRCFRAASSRVGGFFKAAVIDPPHASFVRVRARHACALEAPPSL